jgi:hypothetical protein
MRDPVLDPISEAADHVLARLTARAARCSDPEWWRCLCGSIGGAYVKIVQADEVSFLVAPVILHVGTPCEAFAAKTPEHYLELHCLSPRIERDEQPAAADCFARA